MGVSQQLLFFFSLLGVFNGTLLAFYFLFFNKEKRIANIYFGLLLLALCIRVGKSAFFYFNYSLKSSYIHIGIVACTIIGPLLYLFILHSLFVKRRFAWYDSLHIIPFIITLIMAFQIPYREDIMFWQGTINLIYWQWAAYIVVTIYVLRDVFFSFFTISKIKFFSDIWLVSIVIGVTFVWIGYRISYFTSYIVGAISFSFIFYIFILFIFIARKTKRFKPFKSSKSHINQDESVDLLEKINALMMERKVYKDSNLKMPELASMLEISTHQLSQFINTNLGKNFSQFVNEYRIQEAEKLLISEKKLTIDGIGSNCGFNSSSTFYTAFKKLKGVTPKAYKKQSSAL